MIYHIASGAAWTQAQAQGQYCPPSLADEGFIHCSTRGQVLGVADDFYRGRADLRLLCIDEKRLKSELRWEAPAHPDPARMNPSQDDALFPHIYGALNLDAVVCVADFNETESGFALPPDLP